MMHIYLKDITKLLILIAVLVFVGGFFLGRHSIPSAKEYESRIAYLEESVQILEKDLLYCWNELPLGCIREGSIDY